MSRLDDITAEIEAYYADPTVAFANGSLRLGEYSQQRTILLVRQSGTLAFSAAPGRRQFQASATHQVFVRRELIEFTLRAENEAALDAMFDRLVNSIFGLYGPNALEDTNRYRWVGEDSENAGSFQRRNPAIKLYAHFDLAALDLVGQPTAAVDSFTGTVTQDGAVANLSTP